MATTLDQDAAIWGDESNQDIDVEVLAMTAEEIRQRTRQIENEMRLMNQELQRLNHEQANLNNRIKDNKERVKLSKQLPYLVGNVVEILSLPKDEEEEEDGSAMDVDDHREGKSAVINLITFESLFRKRLLTIAARSVAVTRDAIKSLSS